MKKLFLLMVVILMFVVVFTGCTQTTVKPETSETPSVSPAVNSKVKVNIEGVISEIDGNRIKLDSGKWVVITGDTKFEDDPDNGREAVNNEFAVGNFVQGFTEGDPEGEEVTAYCIYTNEAMKVNPKVKVNIEGVISEIDGNRIKFNSGKWVVIAGDTKFEDDPDNGREAVNNEFVVGNFVQGFTEGDPEGEEVTAYCIYKNEAK